MNQQRRGLLFYGGPKSASVRVGGAFDLQESPVILAASGLTGPVTIQYLIHEIDEWVDVVVSDKPLQLTPSNTFLPLTVQGAYRIKPGEATGAAVIRFAEVTSVPEWNWGNSGGGDSAPADSSKVEVSPALTAPKELKDTPIPNTQIGKEDAALLAAPTNGFKSITVDGEVVAVVPDYAGDLA